jgi:hypothetical protein
MSDHLRLIMDGKEALLFWRWRQESRAISRASCADGAKLLCLPFDLFSWIGTADWVTYGSSDVLLRTLDEPASSITVD